MTELERKMLTVLGLTEDATRPQETVAEQVADLAEYIDCLAELVLGGKSDGN